MHNKLRLTFLIDAAGCVPLGALLWLVPGRFLQWIGWAPIDPILSRVLGATLLAFAWADLRCWRAPALNRPFVELQLGFAALSAAGVLRHLLRGRWPAMVWMLFFALVLLAVAWAALLWTSRGADSPREVAMGGS